MAYVDVRVHYGVSMGGEIFFCHLLSPFAGDIMLRHWKLVLLWIRLLIYDIFGGLRNFKVGILLGVAYFFIINVCLRVIDDYFLKCFFSAVAWFENAVFGCEIWFCKNQLGGLLPGGICVFEISGGKKFGKSVKILLTCKWMYKSGLNISLTNINAILVQNSFWNIWRECGECLPLHSLLRNGRRRATAASRESSEKGAGAEIGNGRRSSE